jgi:hypothetical protein
VKEQRQQNLLKHTWPTSFRKLVISSPYQLNWIGVTEPLPSHQLQQDRSTCELSESSMLSFLLTVISERATTTVISNAASINVKSLFK